MATVTVRHAKVSAVADSSDSNLIQPSDWNDDHAATLSGVVAADITDSTSTGRDLLTAANAAAGRTTLSAAASGAVGSSGLTMATARILGRTTASTGAIEEIVVGSNLTLSGGTLSGTGGGGASSLDGLSDVTLTAPADGDVLTYDTGTSQWVNAAPSGGAASVTMLVRSTDLTVASALVVVGWDTELIDDSNTHSNSTNNSRITVPSGYTRGRFTFYAAYQTGAGDYYVGIEKNSAGTSTAANGVANHGRPGNINEGYAPITTGIIPVSSGDHYEAVAYLTGSKLLYGPAGNRQGRSYFCAEFWP